MYIQSVLDQECQVSEQKLLISSLVQNVAAAQKQVMPLCILVVSSHLSTNESIELSLLVY